ncbi:MAG TPA: ABC transporter substrate-binding protein [Spirochaetota bacterium]|nr:ABC transporter substrate-binding protein [Spirochaetota bacterium]
MKDKIYLLPLAFILSLLMSCGSNSSFQSQLPRHKTLFVNGMQFGTPANFNLMAGNTAFPVGNTHLAYEPLFMYNQLTGKLHPLLGKKYTWVNKYELKVSIHPAAHWNDGHPLTAADVVYTYMLAQKYDVPWSNIWKYLASVKAINNAVIFRLKKKPYNKLLLLGTLCGIHILPRHIWKEKEQETGQDLIKLRKIFNTNWVGSGAYKYYFHNDIKIAVKRDPEYWGTNIFGKLPAPEYIVHIIFKANDAGSLAFRKGKIDFSQQFIPKVWKMWENGAPVSTYYKKAPYYHPGLVPILFFNLAKKGLNRQKVRLAIAHAIDYKKIAEIAMSGYAPPMQPSLDNGTDIEKKYFNQQKINHLQWHTDLKKANKILEEIGAVKGKDGIRVLPDDTRLGPFTLECPYGWSDWNAALEIVMLSCRKIGIEMRTKFPEQPVWWNDLATGNFDLIMNNCPNPSISQPWERARFLMYAKGVPPRGEQAYWNYGRFEDKRADKLIELVPAYTDPAISKKYYTELAEIYLKQVPSIPLMYRPWFFYTYNETHWQGFPDENSSPKYPPQFLYGSGLWVLYKITPKK